MSNITVSSILSVLLAFFAALILGYIFIPLLRRLKAAQQIRDDGPQTHLSKAGTPTMGGIVIMLGTVIASLVIFTGGYDYIQFSLLAALGFGLVGMLDDLIIVVKRRSLGLRAWQKIAFQLVFSALIAYFAYKNEAIGSSIYIPIANVEWDLGLWYIPFNMFVIIAMVNSVNLTDGLDGLASGVSIINSATYVIIFIGLGTTMNAVYAPQMAVFAAAVTGGCLGFLRFNSYPAKVFMGDTGSFFLGGALVIMSIVSRMQIMILVMGFMFVLTSVSCILQVGSYKLRHKRIFKMAPLHHHFELKGIKETKIVATYMIITVVLCLLALLMLS